MEQLNVRVGTEVAGAVRHLVEALDGASQGSVVERAVSALIWERVAHIERIYSEGDTRLIADVRREIRPVLRALLELEGRPVLELLRLDYREGQRPGGSALEREVEDFLSWLPS